MLFLLSPAKALDYDSPAPADLETTTPVFQAQAAELIKSLKTLSASEVGQLMHLSEKLAQLNHSRYQSWRAKPAASMTKAAALAFNGDVYEGLDALSLNAKQLDWLNSHLRILSGLYGVLRPLDALQAYRLEMGTRFGVGGAENLYQYWKGRIAPHLNEVLAAGGHQHVINLASGEYFKAVDVAALQVPVTECRFEDYSKDQYKVISFLAKRARGRMVRWAALNKPRKPADLQQFDDEGYVYAPALSQPQQLVFQRKR